MSTTQTPLQDKPQGEAHGVAEARPLFDGPIVRRAIIDSFWKLNPRSLLKNPVIFTVEVVSVLVTVRIVADIVSGGPIAFDTAIAIGLWFTVLFANFAEAMAEGRGKAQAEALRRTRADLVARRLLADGTEETVPASQLRKGDLVMISAGELIPGDGEIEEGIASVDESAITGESAPVIRESGGDRSAVTAGTKVLSDWIKVRVTAEPGESFLDRMIDLVEGAERQKTPNEIALSILLAKFTIIFLIVCVCSGAVRDLRGSARHGRRPDRPVRLPDPDHDRRPALGDRHRGDGPAGPAQRARDERPRGRGRRRRLNPAARQDRDDHPRQPAGGGVRGGAWGGRARAGRGGAVRVAGRRDPRGPFDRGPCEGAVRDPRARAGGDARILRPVHCADTDERRRPRRQRDPQGRRRLRGRMGRTRHAARARGRGRADLCARAARRSRSRGIASSSA